MLPFFRHPDFRVEVTHNEFVEGLLFADDFSESSAADLPHFRLPGFCFLQGDYMVVEARCSFEKGVKIGVGGDCPGVVDAEHEAISMASR
ncbi:unnamed protein product [Strongylus vulgaris]|uniref:Uncharacterized protein n=1 Tax=Strongylus vulgaris TaxID=40348 RepID=A0A3P7IVB6_STRVU|nr:unnamed protein product [Strongylus vulgaris]